MLDASSDERQVAWLECISLLIVKQRTYAAHEDVNLVVLMLSRPHPFRTPEEHPGGKMRPGNF